jgi:hypothetical protein
MNLYYANMMNLGINDAASSSNIFTEEEMNCGLLPPQIP